MRCGDPGCTKSHPPLELAEVAVRALVRVQNGQRSVGMTTLAYIGERWGTAGLVWASRMWCTLVVENTALKHSTPERCDGLTFGEIAEDGTLDATRQHNVDDVDAGWRWAGRFLLASWADDLDQLEALIGSVEHDTDILVDAVAHLLLACGAAVANPDRVVVQVGETS